MTAAEPPATPSRRRSGGVTTHPALLALAIVVGALAGVVLLRGCVPARPVTGAAPATTSTEEQAVPTATTAATTTAAASAPPVITSGAPTSGGASAGSSAGPPTTIGPVTVPPATTETTAATTSAPAPTTAPGGATTTVPVPCTPAALTAALTTGRVDLRGTTLVDPRCTADFASVMLRAPGTLDRFAVFELREPVWAVVNVGTSFVCQPLEIPNPDYTDIGCLRWDH